MEDFNPIITIATSAGVGAFISSVITLVGQYFERRARRRELLLEKAIDIAKSRTELVLHMADKTGESAKFYDEAFLAETYYQWFYYLLKKGKLPADAKERQKQSGYMKKKTNPYIPDDDAEGS